MDWPWDEISDVRRCPLLTGAHAICRTHSLIAHALKLGSTRNVHWQLEKQECVQTVGPEYSQLVSQLTLALTIYVVRAYSSRQESYGCTYL